MLFVHLCNFYKIYAENGITNFKSFLFQSNESGTPTSILVVHYPDKKQNEDKSMTVSRQELICCYSY